MSYYKGQGKIASQGSSHSRLVKGFSSTDKNICCLLCKKEVLVKLISLQTHLSIHIKKGLLTRDEMHRFLETCFPFMTFTETIQNG